MSFDESSDVPEHDPAEAAAELGDIEELPLDERAPRYHSLADRLREALEHSDPSRGDG